jgi:4-hydroxybenzoate polyprenyltransferase
MCLVITIILSAFAFNALVSGHLVTGSFALLGALFFLLMMFRNIIAVRRRMNDKKQSRVT